jgi:hypothetical protein
VYAGDVDQAMPVTGGEPLAVRRFGYTAAREGCPDRLCAHETLDWRFGGRAWN